jgi:hypothetical protein
MDAASKSFDYTAAEKIFSKTFSHLSKALPNGIVRTPTRTTTPINLFEGVAVGAALAIQTRGKILTRGISRWMQSDDLRRYTSGATNTRLMVISRIEFCRDKFLGK